MGQTCSNDDGPAAAPNTEEMNHGKKRRRRPDDGSYSDSESDGNQNKRTSFISFGSTSRVDPNQDESYIEHSMDDPELHDHIPSGSPIISSRNPSRQGGDVLQLAQYNTDHYAAVYEKQALHDRDNSMSDHYYENDDAVYSEEMDSRDMSPTPEVDMMPRQRSMSHALSQQEEDLILGYRLWKGIEVKERNYKFQAFPNCFVGEEAVSWIVSNGVTFTRCQATERVRNLVKKGLIVHVDEDHLTFVDEDYLYCFVSPQKKLKDVGTKYGDVIRDRERSVKDRDRYKLQQIHKVKERCKKGFKIKDRKLMFKSYKQCFVGEEAVSWMVESKVATSRNEAVEIGQMFLDNQFIRHSNSDSVHFKDSDIFYEFVDDRRG